MVGEEVLHSGDGRTALPANVLRKKPSQHLRTLSGRGFGQHWFFGVGVFLLKCCAK